MSSILCCVLKFIGCALVLNGVIGHNILWNTSTLMPPVSPNTTTTTYESPKNTVFTPANNSSQYAANLDILAKTSILPYLETCSSCLKREQVKEQNLMSLKFHILKRLEMQKLPNITIRPNISEKVIHNFYMKHGYRYIRMNETNKKNLFKVPKDNGYYEHYPQQFMAKMKEQEPTSSYGEMEYFDEYDYNNGGRNFDELQYPNEYNFENGYDDTDDDIFSKIKKLYYFPRSIYLLLFDIF